MSDLILPVHLQTTPGSARGPMAYSKSTDISFFNLFQTLSQTPALQGSISVQQEIQQPLKDTLLQQGSVKKAGSETLLPESEKILEYNDIEFRDNGMLDDDLIWIKHEFKADEARHMEQWLTHLVQQPNGLPVPWFYQMVQDLGSDSAQGGQGFSGELMQAITEAYKSGKSIRIALENQTDLILKFHQGRVSAEFLSENPTIQATLQESIAQLRRQLEEKRLPVGDVTYREESRFSQKQKQSDSSDSKDSDHTEKSGL